MSKKSYVLFCLFIVFFVNTTYAMEVTMQPKQLTVGQYLAKRLEEVGINDYFAIPGDYNLTLLDELLKNPKLQMINCCNELNAGYAADGYARSHGVSALVVTFSVGALSAINAIAGAYAEDLPVIVISSGPNTNSEAEGRLMHHTTGEHDYGYVRRMFAQVTKASIIINRPDRAAYLIDHAIDTALKTRKPVYIEIPCNLSNVLISAPHPYHFNLPTKSNAKALKAAVDHVASALNAAVKPVLVAGVKLRPWNAIHAFQKLADKAGYAVASMPNAKGFVSEQDPNFIGIYWGPVSSPGCGEVVESADRYLFAGPLFTDYTTTGFSAVINPKRLIHVAHDFVEIDGQTYSNVFMNEFLTALAEKIKHNDASLKAFKQISGEAPIREAKSPKDLLSVRRLFAQINDMLTDKTDVIVETGDSWFNGMWLKLPNDAHFEIQMQYGSIGWSVGAVLGYAAATHKKRRVIAMIGDGSFQMAAQEISTMIRYGLNPIIFLINNGGYTIEVEIHDGPYNAIKDWKYAELVDVFNANDGKGWSCRVQTEEELQKAIEKAKNYKGFCLIEVMIDRNDCNKSLLQWGVRVAANNGKAFRAN